MEPDFNVRLSADFQHYNRARGFFPLSVIEPGENKGPPRRVLLTGSGSFHEANREWYITGLDLSRFDGAW